jgi:molecular chaperone GrpE
MSKKQQKDKKMHPQPKTEEQVKADVEIMSETVETEIEPELTPEIIDYKDKYLRTMAEFENYRKRTNAEKADWIRHATKELALHICDVLDNFERALLQANAEDLKTSFVQGILLIEKQLASALGKEGIKKIEALEQEFDPEYHEALAHIPSDYDENIVAAIIQNGYTMHDRVIRPVRVAVSNGHKMNTQED